MARLGLAIHEFHWAARAVAANSWIPRPSLGMTELVLGAVHVSYGCFTVFTKCTRVPPALIGSSRSIA